MKDTWDTVKPVTVSDCFRKAGLLSGDVSEITKPLLKVNLLFLSGRNRVS
jgi:hypothetical protein